MAAMEQPRRSARAETIRLRRSGSRISRMRTMGEYSKRGTLRREPSPQPSPGVPGEGVGGRQSLCLPDLQGAHERFIAAEIDWASPTGAFASGAAVLREVEAQEGRAFALMGRVVEGVPGDLHFAAPDRFV